jgi:hypothetical protein
LSRDAGAQREHLLAGLAAVEYAIAEVEQRAQSGASPNIRGLDAVRADLVSALRSRDEEPSTSD